jgi:hypothetical protein
MLYFVPMSDLPNGRTTLHADPEHAGIRALIPLLMLVGIGFSFYLIMGLWALFAGADGRPDYVVLIACAGALPLGIGLAAGVERLLKQFWRSGKTVVVDGTAVTLHQNETARREIYWARPFQLTGWFFSLNGYPRGGRERNFPDSHYCLALQLQQEENRLICFCFLDGKSLEQWRQMETFHEIKPAELFEGGFTSRFTLPTRPQLSAQLLAGPSGRYWLAERNRWQEGVELSPDDFSLLWQRLQNFINTDRKEHG